MPAIRRILVPIKDLDSRRIPAVLKAAQIARGCGASLELFHVLSAEMYPAPLAGSLQAADSLRDEVQRNALRRLAAIADRLRQHGLRVNVSSEWDYPAHDAIIRRAQAVKADLIVASQHAGKHRVPWLMRLTDWELIRSSPIPLLLVKNPRLYRHPNILAAVDPSRAHEKPLTLDRDILRAAHQCATALRGTVHAVHAYERFPLNIPPEVLTPGMLDDLEQQAERTAFKRMARLCGPQRIARKRQHLSVLPPIEAITVTAKETRSAIVAMGALSRSGVKRLLIGNTAEHALDALSCDLLILKPDAFKSPVPKKSRGVAYTLANPSGYPPVMF